MFFGLGEDSGSTGLLLSVDRDTGVVQLDQNDEVKVLQLKNLCKFKDEA